MPVIDGFPFAGASAGIDRRIKIYEQDAFGILAEAVLLCGTVQGGGQAHPGPVVQSGLIIAGNGFLRALDDAERLSGPGRENAQVATAAVASHSADAGDGKAPDHRVVEVVAGMGERLAVRPDGRQPERQLRCRADLSVVPGRAHE